LSNIILGNPGEKRFLMGNEAIARGAIEAGVQVATTYPGTPSSEIADTLAEVVEKTGVYMEYSTNEIVAVETAAGASICGARAMVSMKHVGLNVASDALVTLAYVGVRGGFVLVCCDDPYCWSSQNEQDNRYYALLANIPCLEPSKPQEAKDMLLNAFQISEKLELPVMMRLVTRVSHIRAPVILGSLADKRKTEHVRNPKRFVMVPANARCRHLVLLEKMGQAKEISEQSKFNSMYGRGKFGVITGGASFNYAMEALNMLNMDASVLKLGFINPLPEKTISDFLRKHAPILVVEELEPFLELQVKAVAKDWAPKVKIHGVLEGFTPRHGELSTRIVAEALCRIKGKPLKDYRISKVSHAEELSPRRPPSLCPGCPHMASIYAIKVAGGPKAIYPTDIGCYTLAYQPPQSIGDIVICMGSSAGISCGMSVAVDNPIISIVGDSTFFHASIPGVINAVYNKHRFVYAVLDNLTTAMTNFQPHPGTGVTGIGEITKRILIEDIAEACGVEFVKVVDPFDLKSALSTVREAIKHDGPSVVVFRRICAVLEIEEKRRKGEEVPKYQVDREKCNNCMACIKLLGCPPLVASGGQVSIDEALCVGCGVCAQVCPLGAIIKVGDKKV